MAQAATIRRGPGTQGKRKTNVKGRNYKRTPFLKRMIAKAPVSARTVERAITIFILGVVAFAVIAVLVMIGVPRQVGLALGEAIGRAGFQVKHVQVTGIEHMDRASVYAVALDQQSIAMPLVDLDKVRESLLRYGWIADARVSRRLPDTLVVDIVERKPAAVWQHEQKLTLVDDKGVVLDAVSLNAMPDLPLVIGPDANVQATALTSLMANAPQLKPVLEGAIWVGDRRWNLRFQSGETLMLPEGEAAAAAALRDFAQKDAEHPLLGRGLSRIDMRDPVKTYILPGAAQQPIDQPEADPGVNT